MTDFDWTPYVGDRASFEIVGDKVEGKIVEIHTEEGRKGLYPVVTLQVDKEGNRREVHPAGDLQRKLAGANVQVGDWVRAELVELKHTGQPSPMKVFKIGVKFAQPPAEGAEIVGAGASGSEATTDEAPAPPTVDTAPVPDDAVLL